MFGFWKARWSLAVILRTALAALVLVPVVTLVSYTTQAQHRAFQFAFFGDTGYTSEGIGEFKNVIDAINRTDLEFVVHIGDFQADGGGYSRNPKSGPMPCTDESYQAVYTGFQSIRHPLIFTPGDNDWADCSKVDSRKFDALALLSKIRTMFYPEGKSLGQRTMVVETQSNDPQHKMFRENLRWSVGNVTFATLHIIGSNDNLGVAAETDAEQRERKAANLAWMRAAFAKAKADDSHGLVLLTQANPGFENYWPAAARGRYFGPFVGRASAPPIPRSAFDDYVATLAEELESYERPVAYLHGDTHLHRIDKPLYSKKTSRLFENFTRVETFGAPDTHWVRVTVDPTDPQLFTFKAEIVSANAGSRRSLK